MKQSFRLPLEILACFFICLGLTGVDVFCQRFSQPIPDIAWFIAVASLFVLPILAVRKFRPKDDHKAGIDIPFKVRDILIGIAITVILFIPVAAGYHIFQTQFLGHQFFFDFSRFDLLETSIIYQCLFQIICVAFPEEFFYRGYMQTGWIEYFGKSPKMQKYAVPAAIVISSLFFAISHLPSGNITRLATFFPGLLFGIIRYKTHSLVPAIICHAGCNMMMFVLSVFYA